MTAVLEGLAGALLFLGCLGGIAAAIGDFIADRRVVPDWTELPACWHPRVTPVYLELTGEYVGDLCHSCKERVEPSVHTRWW